MLFPKPIRAKRERRRGVSSDLARFVLLRDRACVASLVGWPHECRTRFGDRHEPTDLERLTLEHVKTSRRMSRRAEDDPQHLVALCGMLNDQVPPAALRDKLREHLAWCERTGRNIGAPS